MTTINPERTIEGKLVDFDWQIRVSTLLRSLWSISCVDLEVQEKFILRCQILLQHVLGSSTSRNLEEPLTQISFIVKNKSEKEEIPARNIIVEFNKSELKQLMSTLQRSL